MAEVVAITTDELEPAVRLRAGFTAVGYAVELLTGSENLDDVVGEPVLLILTGSVRENRGRNLIAQAQLMRRSAHSIGLVQLMPCIQWLQRIQSST